MPLNSTEISKKYCKRVSPLDRISLTMKAATVVAKLLLVLIAEIFDDLYVVRCLSF